MLRAHGISAQKCFLHFFPPALDSKHDLYGWNSIRSSLRIPSGNLKEAAPAKPMVSAARRERCYFLTRSHSRMRWDWERGGKKTPVTA